MLLCLRVLWHKFWLSYTNLLLESCIDEMYRNKLISKVSYHQENITALTNVPLITFKSFDKSI
jgi:predicted phosphoadenosine phosphosulfate sulfurtransferase